MSKVRSFTPAPNIDTALGIATRARWMLRRRFRGWLDALIASRMQKAALENKEHLKLLPDDVLRRAGYRILRKDPGGFLSDR